MLTSNWSDILKSDLDKLSQFAASAAKPITKLKEGERRTVTILFLDIQGFTAMSEKLDPEDVQLIIDNTFKILTHEIEKHHGYIDKYEGDRMMALFGSRQATEQDCDNALRAAIGMKEKFIQINRLLAERKIKIGVRIGVNTGLVVTGRIGKGRDQDFTVMGDTVNLASRLESNAPPGEIMVSEEVKRTAGDLFLYEALGKIEVKGKSEPIPVFCVKGLNPNRAEKWERSPFTQRSRYVRRDSEHEQMQNVWTRLGVEKMGIATLAISGAAGIGKSRLTHEFVQTCKGSSKGPFCFFRASAESSHSSPLGLFSNLVRNCFAQAEWTNELLLQKDIETERYEAVLRYIAGQNEPNERMSLLEPKAFMLELHLGIRFLIERLAYLAQVKDSGPLLLHLEDLHWMDAASVETLDFLGANLNAANPILFLFSFRPEFELTSQRKTLFGCELIELKPLPLESCRTILENVLEGSGLTSKDQEMLILRSGGNPFFMEELIQSLIDDGILHKSGQRWGLARPIEEATLPQSVNRILLSRIDKLDAEHKEMIMAASVVGETIPWVVMKEVGRRMGIDEDNVQKRFGNLEEKGFVLHQHQEVGPLGPQGSFRHALTREVVYSTLLNHNKKILHELLGRTYEGLYGEHADEHAPLLFHHFHQGGQSEEALRYGFLAIDQMLRQYATKEGIELVRMVRPYMDEMSDPVEVRVAKARLIDAEIKFFDFLGKREDQRIAIEALEKMSLVEDNLDLKAKAALARAMYFSGIGDFRQTKEFAAQGLAIGSKDHLDSKLRMELLRALGIACYSMGQYPEALTHYGEGLELSKQLKERSSEGAFYNTIGLVHFNMGQAAAALDFYKRAEKIMTDIGDRRGVGNSAGNQGLVHWTLGEYSKAMAELSQSHAVFKEIGFKKGQAVTLGNLGVIHHKLGKYADALKCYEEALRVRREIHDRAGEGYDLVNIGMVHRHLGNYEKALEYFEAGQWLARDVGSNYLLAENLNDLAIVYRKLGENDPELIKLARERATEALALAQQHHLVPAEVKALSTLARTLLLLGEPQKAVDLSEQAMTIVKKHSSSVEGSEEEAYINHYHIFLELGRKEEARETLRQLVDLIKYRADQIKETEYRTSFLTAVRQNRYALEEWEQGNT